MSGGDTRRQILQAAGEVFADRGFERATVREICRRAAVNLAAINYHFGDKRRLYVEAVKFARQLREEAEPMPELSTSVAPEERLRAFVRTLLRRMLGPQSTWQVRLLTREMLEPTEACEEMLRESIAPVFRQLVAILRDLSPDDARDIDVERAAFSVMGQCVFYRMHGRAVELLSRAGGDQEAYSIEAIADHVSRFSYQAVSVAPRSAGANVSRSATSLSSSRQAAP